MTNTSKPLSISAKNSHGKAQSAGKFNISLLSKTWWQHYGEGTAALLSGVLIIIAWLVEGTSSPASVALYLTAFIVGGFIKAREGILTFAEERELDVNLLMIFAAIGAASIGYWTEGAVLIFIFSLSGALESYTMERSHRDISALMDLSPETARVEQDGEEITVAVKDLVVGQHVIVKPGERIPSDGKLIQGQSAINQASITGESIPVDKEVGDELFAGTLNGQGYIIIEVTQSSESSLFSKIIKLVQEAQSEMPKSQVFIESFERIYAKIIVLVTLLLIATPLVLNWSWGDAFYKAMVFLVVASPCALVASIMPAILSAISNSARKGVLFKGGAHLQNLALCKVIAFDKTGTLTLGEPQVTDVIPFHSYDERSVLFHAASIENLSEHPIARAIVNEAKARDIELEKPDGLTAKTGWGVESRIKEQNWKIGKPKFMDPAFMQAEMLETLTQLEMQGKTVVVMQNELGIAGIIALRDQIRPQTKKTITQLKALGLKVAMLTGDQDTTAQAIAKDAGIDLVFSELLPEDKVNQIKALKEQYGPTIMVGDGVNDAPALATATLGIAMGAGGSDAALETADVVLMNDDTERIAEAIALSQRTKRIVMQNIVFSIGVIAILITVNFIQGIALPLGVIGHEGSTILVILNGLRLLR
jgi:Cd2+/Zn2+-exporting ATPase